MKRGRFKNVSLQRLHSKPAPDIKIQQAFDHFDLLTLALTSLRIPADCVYPTLIFDPPPTRQPRQPVGGNSGGGAEQGVAGGSGRGRSHISGGPRGVVLRPVHLALPLATHLALLREEDGGGADQGGGEGSRLHRSGPRAGGDASDRTDWPDVMLCSSWPVFPPSRSWEWSESRCTP